MELIKVGKTKDVYKDKNGNIVLKFKDSVTGQPDGKSDPGGNVVVGEVAGVGTNALKVTTYYFELLKKANIPTHYISADIAKNELKVKTLDKAFGNGLEFVVRYFAAGSFIKRFGAYCKQGDSLPKVFEVTLKDDERNDPPVTKEIVCALNIITEKEFDTVQKYTIQITDLIKEDLIKKNATLYDIKLEFGIVGGEVVLIDEISAGNMRAFKDGKYMSYDELSKLICS